MIVLPRDSDPLARYESTPLLNHRAPLLGLTITFVVSHPFFRCGVRTAVRTAVWTASYV